MRRDLTVCPYPYPCAAHHPHQRLYLSQNKINNFDANLLGVPELTELTLAVNRLAEVPSDLGACYKLRVFDCSSNVIKSLPCTLGYLPSLSACGVVWCVCAGGGGA